MPLPRSGRVLRGQVVLGSKNFCRGIDPRETRTGDREATERRKPACVQPRASAGASFYARPRPSRSSADSSKTSTSISWSSSRRGARGPGGPGSPGPIEDAIPSACETAQRRGAEGERLKGEEEGGGAGKKHARDGKTGLAALSVRTKCTSRA